MTTTRCTSDYSNNVQLPVYKSVTTLFFELIEYKVFGSQRKQTTKVAVRSYSMEQSQLVATQHLEPATVFFLNTVSDFESASLMRNVCLTSFNGVFCALIVSVRHKGTSVWPYIYIYHRQKDLFAARVVPPS